MLIFSTLHTVFSRWSNAMSRSKMSTLLVSQETQLLKQHFNVDKVKVVKKTHANEGGECHE